jgi:hypothetical protein
VTILLCSAIFDQLPSFSLSPPSNQILLTYGPPPSHVASYDCSINAVSDAVHHSGHLNLDGRKAVSVKGTGDKLVWLHENNRLPLPQHQAVGSLFMKKKVLMEGNSCGATFE